jgi:hypothetical protein
VTGAAVTWWGVPKYLVILRSDPDQWRQKDARAIEDLVARFEAWAGELMAHGRYLDGHKVADGEGRVLQRRGDTVQVASGTFGQRSEVIGGCHLIEADDYEHAVRLCREHPELLIGGSVEIRRLDTFA